MPPRAPKLRFTSEADAADQIVNFEAIREQSNEAAAALKRLRDAYEDWFARRLADDPLWDETVIDAEHGRQLARETQPWGHYYAVRDMPNEMILFLAEHGALTANNTIIDALMGGDAPPRELIDIGRYRHAGARQTYVITPTRSS